MRIHSCSRFSLRALLFALCLVASSSASFAEVSISVSFGPPALPVYKQPICPGDGYIWTPGYWAWDGQDYYWVPGTWVLAPEVGYLWTPPYWGWSNGLFIFHQGYWGPHVGFYGGVVYGFGYFGSGFVGGRWDRGHYFYNRSVTNINVVNVRNVYNENVTNKTVNYVSYNGGPGGIAARPSSQEQAAARDRHLAPIAAQTQQFEAARGNQSLKASANHGKPPIAATPRPAAFTDRAIVPARQAGGAYNPPAQQTRAGRAAGNGGALSHGAQSAPAPAAQSGRPNDLHTGNANNGNADHDRQVQQQTPPNRQGQQPQRQQQAPQQQSRRNTNGSAPQQIEQPRQQQPRQMQQQHGPPPQEQMQQQGGRQQQSHDQPQQMEQRQQGREQPGKGQSDKERPGK